MKFCRTASILLIIFLLLGNFGFVRILHAQSDPSVEARRAELERELQEVEREIAEQTVFLEGKQKERVSLERDIAIIDAKIGQSRLQIRATELKIQSLTRDIGLKELTIDELNAKTQREKESLAQILRRTNEVDSFSLVEVVLDNRNLSDFFEDLDSFSSIKLALSDSFIEIENTKDITSSQKKVLESKREEERSLRNLQIVQRQRLEAQEAERQEILDITKGEEAVYQKLVDDKQRTAAQIRAELFALRDTAPIPFGEALAYAKRAEDRTGVRSALILGILREESNLGANVGTGSWITDMHPDRDRPVFEVITRSLGLNPDSVPVSKKPWYGWGGAMGPAQFIPSTWACYAGYVNSLTGSCRWGKGYTGTWSYDASKDSIRKLLGINSPSNPWIPEHAIMAAADLLNDNGASKGGYNAERLASLRYFAGWANATKPAYAFYGDDVMGFAAEYQSLIDILGN